MLIKFLAVFIFVALTSPAAAQTVSKICDKYARYAVQYQRQNLESGCGLRGPQWNSDYRYHYNWCVRGNNYRGVDKWTAWRGRSIANCRRVKVPQKTAGKAPNPWLKRLKPIENNLSVRLNNGINAIRNKSRKPGVKWIKMKPVPLTGLMAASKSAALKNLTRFDKTYQSALKKARMDPQKAHLPPKIHSVLSMPRNGRIEPGSSLLITGSNFGNKPGGVYLRYTVGRETSSSEFRKEKTVVKTIPLKPYKGTWAKSWFSNFVVATATGTYSDPGLQADRTGQLLVVLPDGSQAAASITVGAGSPEILAIKTKGGNNWVRPGEEFTVLGRNFGAKPGKARLALSQGSSKRWLRVKGTNHFVYWPTKGPQPAGTVGSVGMQVLSWSNQKVKLRAGYYRPKRYFGGAVATMILHNRAGRSGLFNNIWFGPDTEVKMVSGYKWLDAKARKDAKPTSNGGAMLVSHTPSCHWYGGTADKGGDMFFGDAPWPNDVEVIAFDFKQINPENPYTDLDFFLDQAGEILNALDSGPFGVALYIGKKILSAIISGGGGYHAYVQHAPGGYSWNKGPHVIAIGWESSCDLGGKPIVYVVSFTITGTKQALARY